MFSKFFKTLLAFINKASAKIVLASATVRSKKYKKDRIGMRTMENQARNTDEIEIDVLEVLYNLKKKLWIVLTVTLLCGSIAGVFAGVVMNPVYTSTSKMLVLTKETTLSSLADLQMGSQLAHDYRILIESRPVLEKVLEDCGLSGIMEYEQLRKKMTIENLDNSRILSISIEDNDPEQAKLLVDTIANASADYIAASMEITPPKIIENGEIPTEKSSPSVMKFILVGTLVGLLAMAGTVTVQTILNDTIQCEEDIQKYLDVSALAVVPDKALEGKNTGKGAKPKKRKKKSWN